jgi:hypothetical protein
MPDDIPHTRRLAGQQWYMHRSATYSHSSAGASGERRRGEMMWKRSRPLDDDLRSNDLLLSGC